SMNSARQGNRQTVPLRPGGGAQRAKRSETPSRVLTVPVTTPSGTGLAGMETRFMGEGGRKDEMAEYGWDLEQASCAVPPLLRSEVSSSPGATEGRQARKPPSRGPGDE